MTDSKISAIIYKMVQIDNDEVVYIGSTTQKLCDRFSQHKVKALKCPERQIYKYISENKGFDNFELIKIKEGYFDNVDDLRTAENNKINEFRKQFTLLNVKVSNFLKPGFNLNYLSQLFKAYF